MPFPFERLRAAAGTLYGHLFENASTGVDRNVFWNLSISFEPVEFDEDEWEPSLACEWLAFPLRRWTELDGMGLERVLQRDAVEASFYVFEHDLCELLELRLSRSKGAVFDVSVKADLRFGEETQLVQIACPLQFEGIYVLPENLFPKPNTPVLASEALAAFVDVTDFGDPVFDRFRYTFAPRL